MKIVCDIDGVICTNTWGDYCNAQPINDNIDRVNALAKDNHIILFTARGTTTGIDWRILTEKQMKEWGVSYHELIFGKPEGTFYIDDKGVSIDEVWERVSANSPC